MSYTPSRRALKEDGIAVAIGVVVGLVASTVNYFSARAAVKVRPNLAEVGFIDAALTNHGADWLFYNHPAASTIVTILVFCLVLVTIQRWLSW